MKFYDIDIYIMYRQLSWNALNFFMQLRVYFNHFIPSPCKMSLKKSRCSCRSDQTSAFSTSASFMIARSVTTSVGTWASCMSETRAVVSNEQVVVLHKHTLCQHSELITAFTINLLLKRPLHSCKCTLLTEEPAILLAPLVCDDVKLLAFSDQAQVTDEG